MRNIVIALLLLACVASFLAGRSSGIRHAIEDCEIWAVECYDPDNPAASAWGEYDLRVFIDLDGQTYEHGLTQG